MRVASFFFALEHIGGFGGVADRLNAYNVFRGDPSLITTDVERFRTRYGTESLAGRTSVISTDVRESSLSVVGRQKAAVGHRRSTGASSLPQHAPVGLSAAVARRSSPCRAGFRSGSSRAAICRPWPARSSSRAGRASSSRPGGARPVDGRHARRGNVLSHGGSRSRWPPSRWAQRSPRAVVGTGPTFRSGV